MQRKVGSQNEWIGMLALTQLLSGLYQEGDFIANFHGCQRDAARNCEEEMNPLMSRWRELRDQERKRK